MIETLVEQIRNGDRRVLARAATSIENGTLLGRELVKALFPFTGRTVVLGITGPPGAGKSTLVAALARVLRGQNKTVGILAVDPSSSLTNGAILGDRIRMQEHYADVGVFIRSLATRGQLGGLAAATFDMTLLLDAAGFDVVLVETVGVGQDEIDVAGLADVTVVVLVPGLGDDVQAIKAGILEIADVFAINKADLPGADRLEQEIRAMQSFGNEARLAPIRKVIATEGIGISELLEIALNNKQKKPKIEVWQQRLQQLLWNRLLAAVPEQAFTQAALDVSERRTDPFTATNFLLQAATANAGAAVEIDHLGIAVRSLDESLRFYRDQLGIAVRQCETVEAEQVHVAMLPAGSARIELLEATQENSTIARFIEKRGPGLHHLALKVDDLNATAERLRQAGAKLLNEPRFGAGGHLYVFVHPQSAGGVLLELIQR